MPGMKGIDSNAVVEYIKAHPELSYQKIGEQFGIVASSAAYYGQKAGIHRRLPRTEANKKFGAAAIAEIVRLRKQGFSYGEIEKQTGAKPGTIGYYLKKAGMPSDYSRPPKRNVNGKVVDVLTGAETLSDRVLDAAWNALTATEKAALLFGACSKQ